MTEEQIAPPAVEEDWDMISGPSISDNIKKYNRRRKKAKARFEVSEGTEESDDDDIKKYNRRRMKAKARFEVSEDAEESDDDDDDEIMELIDDKVWHAIRSPICTDYAL